MLFVDVNDKSIEEVEVLLPLLIESVLFELQLPGDSGQLFLEVEPQMGQLLGVLLNLSFVGSE